MMEVPTVVNQVLQLIVAAGLMIQQPRISSNQLSARESRQIESGRSILKLRKQTNFTVYSFCLRSHGQVV